MVNLAYQLLFHTHILLCIFLYNVYMSHLYHLAGMLCNVSCFMVCGKDYIKIIPVHGMKAYKSEGTAPFILNHSTTYR
jgi:hypothetical protein